MISFHGLKWVRVRSGDTALGRFGMGGKDKIPWSHLDGWPHGSDGWSTRLGDARMDRALPPREEPAGAKEEEASRARLRDRARAHEGIHTGIRAGEGLH